MDKIAWEFLRSETKQYIPYPSQINSIIEQAYLQGKPSVQWIEDAGTYRITFADKTEHDVSNPTSRVTVRRRIIGAEEECLPPSWTTETPNKDGYCLVDVQSSTKEYQEVVDNFTKTAQGYQILKVERIQNPHKYQAYCLRLKETMHKDPTMNNAELLLFHGTAKGPIDQILRNGFNRSYCGKNALFFGEGVYFAVEAKYSCRDQYSVPDQDEQRYIFQCRVIAGRYTQGKEGMRVLPPVDPNVPAVIYDTLVDNESSPQICVTFHDDQAYPEYLITFKK